MNYNPKIFTEDTQTIVKNYGLMSDVIKVMTLCDGIAPAGSCCGKNNIQIANKFITNKKNYKLIMEKIEKRLIKTIKPGIIYISPLKRMVNLDTLTDQEIVKFTKKGYISKDRFDWKAYEVEKAKQAEKIVVDPEIIEPQDEPQVEETPENTEVETPTVETKPKKGKKSSK